MKKFFSLVLLLALAAAPAVSLADTSSVSAQRTVVSAPAAVSAVRAPEAVANTTEVTVVRGAAEQGRVSKLLTAIWNAVRHDHPYLSILAVTAAVGGVLYNSDSARSWLGLGKEDTKLAPSVNTRKA